LQTRAEGERRENVSQRKENPNPLASLTSWRRDQGRENVSPCVFITIFTHSLASSEFFVVSSRQSEE